MPLTRSEGSQAVRLARETLEAHVHGRRVAGHGELSGVFGRLNSLEGVARSLRGCIGYPEPIKPLAEAIRDVTIYASEDPRFPHPVLPEELDHVVVEVSVLTLPTALRAGKRTDLPSMIRLGVDGIIISNSFTSGLFLPQVAVEQGWDQETFITEACGKAGLPSDAWLDKETDVKTFQAEIFAEKEPRGKVERESAEPV